MVKCYCEMCAQEIKKQIYLLSVRKPESINNCFSAEICESCKNALNGVIDNYRKELEK